MQTRRGLIRGIGALLCAPAIVRASSLMPVSVVPAVEDEIFYGVSFGGFKVGDIIHVPLNCDTPMTIGKFRISAFSGTVITVEPA